MFSLPKIPNRNALWAVRLQGVFILSQLRRTVIKYFDIDTTVSQLVNGEVTRFQIKAIRNTNRKHGYKEREEFFNEVLRRFDLIRAAQKETDK